MKSALFLGGGRITSALLAGLHRARSRAPIIVHDRNPHKLRALKREYGISVETDLGKALAHADVLMVAVRPGSVTEVLSQVRQTGFSTLSRRRAKPLLACSLAAGIPLSQLRAQLGRPVIWCRAMPSPAARSGRGLTALTFDRGFPDAARGRVERDVQGEMLDRERAIALGQRSSRGAANTSISRDTPLSACRPKERSPAMPSVSRT